MNAMAQFLWAASGTWPGVCRGAGRPHRAASEKRLVVPLAWGGFGFAVQALGDGVAAAPRRGSVSLLPSDVRCLTSAAGLVRWWLGGHLVLGCVFSALGSPP